MVVLGYVRGDNYVVKGFYPAPPIIEISPQTPKSVANELVAAFSLFWVDLGACANKLRIRVEQTLDALDVPAARNLDKRIKDFQNIDPDHADTFDALRRVGNVGSHEGNLGRKTILQAFEIYEHALRNLFNPDRKRVDALRKKIRTSMESRRSPG